MKKGLLSFRKMYNIRLILYTEEKQKVKFARERNLLTWSKFSFFQIISVNRRRSSSNFRGLLWRHFRLDYVTKWRHKYYNLAAIMVGPTCPTVQLAPVSKECEPKKLNVAKTKP